MRRSQLIPALCSHPLSPVAVVPQLRVLGCRGCFDPWRALLVANNLTVPNVHRVVKLVSPGNSAASALRALLPVFAVILLGHAGRTETLHRLVEVRLMGLWLGLVEEGEPPYLSLR